MKRLDGKIALVTGGSRGIGRGIAQRLANDGAVVAVHYGSNHTKAAEVVDQIKQNGGHAFALQADLRKKAEIDQFVQQWKEQLLLQSGKPQFDILVNNAGIGTSQSFEETTEDEFDQLFAVNVKAPFFLTQKLLSSIRDGGRIINVSSGVTRIPFPQIMAYNLTKGAINTFTMHLAHLLGSRKITVNAVLPGIIDTDVNASWLHTPEGQSLAKNMAVLGRAGEASDIADVVAFLASEDARFITGDMIDATGGGHA
jgi:NAD(P)-dependent dehydrogenase (short-subunit alcohol dehydrogenase family)